MAAPSDAQVGLRDGDTVYFARSPIQCVTASHDGNATWRRGGGTTCGHDANRIFSVKMRWVCMVTYIGELYGETYIGERWWFISWWWIRISGEIHSWLDAYSWLMVKLCGELYGELYGWQIKMCKVKFSLSKNDSRRWGDGEFSWSIVAWWGLAKGLVGWLILVSWVMNSWYMVNR